MNGIKETTGMNEIFKCNHFKICNKKTKQVCYADGVEYRKEYNDYVFKWQNDRVVYLYPEEFLYLSGLRFVNKTKRKLEFISEPITEVYFDVDNNNDDWSSSWDIYGYYTEHCRKNDTKIHKHSIIRQVLRC